jgi:hypothetical protein
MIHKAIGFEYENPAHALKEAMARKNPTKKRRRHERRSNHNESGVPSSASWNPTKPLIRRQV